MRHSLIAFAVTAMTLTGAEWKLVWSDEFNGEKLDYKKWGVEENAFGGGNHELQIYTDRPKNVRVANGRLILEAHQDNAQIAGTQRRYSSGRIRTKHRGDWKYGRIEVKAKLPAGRGLWPAIWMLPTDEKYGTWASSGEIDIMEFKGQERDRYHGTLHYGGKWPNNKHSGAPFVKPKTDFTQSDHVYGIEWEAGAIRWYIDGKLWQTQKKWTTDGGSFPAPFDQRFHLILNLAVGGGFVGNPDSQTRFPARMEVDWVRVYQKP